MDQIESNPVEEELSNLEEIQSGKNQVSEETVEILPPATPSFERKISGFWRRLLAISIDMIILGVWGLILGCVFFDAFCQMGSQGFWVGLIITITYFGWMNSSLKDGQTIGKRIMKIRVVDVNGDTITFGKSLIRSAILFTPYMFTPFFQGTVAQLISAIMIFVMVRLLLTLIINGHLIQYLFGQNTMQLYRLSG